MARLTLSILEGLERGRVFRNIETPVTIGREEDNTVQLNDERVSRLHAKLQEDQGQVIFTDLNSTNGSRVNGHPVQLRVMRAGDHLQLGRCTLLFGSEEEVALRARRMGLDVSALLPWKGTSSRAIPAGGAEDADFSLAEDLNPEHLLSSLFFSERPELPLTLTAGQRARISDVLAYIHERLNGVVVTGLEPQQTVDNQIQVPWERWQNLLLLQRDLAQWLQAVSNPDEPPPR